MKLFFAFIRKEFWHVLRDTRSLIILLGLPVMMMLLFGFALSNEVKNSNIGILDLSHDESTIQLTDRFDQSRYFSVTQKLKRESEIEQAFRKNELRMVIFFSPNFQENLSHNKQAQIRFIGDATDPNTSNIMINYATAIIRNYQNEILGEQKLPYRIELESSMLYNPKLSSAFNFVPGVMTLILMLLGAMMTSSFYRQRERKRHNGNSIGVTDASNYGSNYQSHSLFITLLCGRFTDFTLGIYRA